MPTMPTRPSALGQVWLRLTLGALTFLGAVWLFGGIAEDVVNADPLTLFDAQVATWLHAHPMPVVTRVMLLISATHGVMGISIGTVLLASWWLRKRDWYWLTAVAAAVPGGMLLNVLAKHAFTRARPVFGDPFVVLSSYSFPSGHVAGTTLLYGVATAFLVTHLQAWQWRVLVVLLAMLMISLVALSRLYLGVHYVSDVLAAFAEGVAWLALCFTLLNALRRR